MAKPSNRRGLTPEQRRERLNRSHEQLQSAVEQLTSSQGWRSMLAARAWLRRYSLNNLLLITEQCPNATDVRPWNQWKQAGRHVRKGEKAIKILAPVRYRTSPETDDSNNTADTDNTDPTERPGRQVRGFTLVSVFDVAQTEGAELPDTEPARPQELRGLAPDALWDQVAGLITSRGFEIERGDCGPAYGWVKFAKRTVRVRADVEPAQAVKTLVHELAHIVCGHATRPDASRNLREVEAESVACLVADVAGLDSLPYSVPYVAGWAGDAATAHASAHTVIAAADQITAALAADSESTAA
ncbi:hypothetical protein GCM10023224_15690 [Streptomonospora halophila]|uniref:N-terminal domain-containing protein n=1 Tax=Streptomonospora halophila TaxID=427369 RepID=A0ABP9GAQ6_9ACTN